MAWNLNLKPSVPSVSYLVCPPLQLFPRLATHRTLILFHCHPLRILTSLPNEGRSCVVITITDTLKPPSLVLPDWLRALLKPCCFLQWSWLCISIVSVFPRPCQCYCQIHCHGLDLMLLGLFFFIAVTAWNYLIYLLTTCSPVPPPGHSLKSYQNGKVTKLDPVDPLVK